MHAMQKGIVAMMRDEELFPMLCHDCKGAGEGPINYVPSLTQIRAYRSPCTTCNGSGVVLARSIETQLEDLMPPHIQCKVQTRRNWRRYLKALNSHGVTAEQLAENIHSVTRQLRTG